MIYGRVIGSELRDVPPECLPIWGQRWSGYRAPHGPSPFSTRIFSVDRMSEMGPALTSPAQFERTLAEEDEGGDTSSESSRLHNSFLSSPLATQPGVAELTSRPETPMPRSDHCSSAHLHGSPKILHWSTGYPPPQKSTCFSTTLLYRQRSEKLGIQRFASEPLLHPAALPHEISVQGGYGSLRSDCGLWDMDRTSINVQPRSGPSHGSRVADSHTQSPAHPLQPNSLPHPGNDYFIQPFNAGDRTRFPPMILPSSHCFTIPFSQQNVGVDSPGSHEPNISVIPSIAHHRNPMISQWPPGSVSPHLSFQGPLQNSESSLGLGVAYHLVSGDQRNPHPEDFFDTLAHAESCTPSSLDGPGDDQFTR